MALLLMKNEPTHTCASWSHGEDLGHAKSTTIQISAQQKAGSVDNDKRNTI